MSLQHALPQDDTVGHVTPSSTFVYNGATQGHNITELSSVQSGILGSLIMAEGMPTYVSEAGFQRKIARSPQLLTPLTIQQLD